MDYIIFLRVPQSTARKDKHASLQVVPQAVSKFQVA